MSVHFREGGTCPVCGRELDDYGTCICVGLPSLEEPEEGDCCPLCGDQRVIRGFCGNCEERVNR